MTKEQISWLENNKGNLFEFIKFSNQSFEFCVEAVKNAKKNDKLKFLTCIDPEFRTSKLLRDCNVNDFDHDLLDDEDIFKYEIKSGYAENVEDWLPGNDEGSMYYLYGYCNPTNLEVAQKSLRRCLELHKTSFSRAKRSSNFWGNNPLDADCFYEKTFNNENYFLMVFGYDYEVTMDNFLKEMNAAWHEKEFKNNGIKNLIAEQFNDLNLFMYNDVYTSYNFGCEYYFQEFSEGETYNFEVSEYNNANEVHQCRLEAVRKLFEYNIIRNLSQYKPVKQASLKKAEKELGKYNKRAEETEESERIEEE